MRQILLFLIFIFALIFEIKSQDITRARLTIDSLCLPGLHGRGPSLNGDSIAAFYIKRKFESIHLKKFTPNFFQYFSYDANIFNGKANIFFGKQELIPGKDFILHPSSGKGKRVLTGLYLDTNIFTNTSAQNAFFKKNLKDKALIFTTGSIKKFQQLPNQYYLQLFQSGCLIETIEKKLTASISGQQYPSPYFQILLRSIPKKIKKVSVDVDAELKNNYTSRNILGYVPATIPTDSFIVVSAHYDHLGTLGKDDYFPGANDNASGISMLLELAHHYSASTDTINYNILFIAFAAEEIGLLGSKYYTEHPFFPLKKIRFLINLDLMGTGDEGMMAVNGAVFPKEFSTLEKINNEKNYLPALKKRGKAANSDHYFFSERGVPAFFFYTLGGIPAYHDMYDRAETLPLTKYKEVFLLLKDFINSFQPQ